MHNPSIGSLYNIYFMYMVVHLHEGVGWNLAALVLFPLCEYLVYPHDAFRTLEWLCLVLWAIGRRRVVDNCSRYGSFSRWWFYVVYDSDRLMTLCETGQGN
jgi:hypothetical protein